MTVPQPRPVDDERSMRSVVLDLRAEFPAVPADELTALVQHLWACFDGALVRDYVPLLVRKQARDELRGHPGPRAGAAAVSTLVRSSVLS
jgi:hypothetical protein